MVFGFLTQKVGVFFNKDIYCEMKELIRHIIREHTKEIGEQRSTKKLTTDEFIKRAKEIHGDEYDYSNTEYINNRTPVKIICPTHGEFNKSPVHHLRGQGCPICGNEQRKKSLSRPEDEFIRKASEIHGNKFDYSKVDYKNKESKITIICPIHGEFSQHAGSHLRGTGCPKCSGKAQGTTESFIENSEKVHGDKYDYSNVNYVNAYTPVEIICKKHGSFTQKPNNHLNGAGCPRCSESKGENLVNEILSSYNISYTRQYKFSDCTNNAIGRYCRKLPFDFYVPIYNTTIEFDGQQHFIPVFGEEEFKRLKKTDKLKDKYCEQNGIKLIRIPYTMKKTDIEPYILKELGL